MSWDRGEEDKGAKTKEMGEGGQEKKKKGFQGAEKKETPPYHADKQEWEDLRDKVSK